jgi:hypothetical protein
MTPWPTAAPTQRALAHHHLFWACNSNFGLERVPINWNQLIGKTTLYFKVLEQLAFAQSGDTL